MKLQTSAALAFAAVDLASAVSPQGLGRSKKRTACSVSCPSDSKFESISAQKWISAANPGWNVGNTLDALPNEGSWNNPPLQGSTLDVVQASGYKSVRIPVTYTEHFVSGSPEWKINSTWLQRVSDVVDMATSRGLYVITNIHHDSWAWADVTKPDANQTQIQERFYASWLQIGKTLACKSSLVALEPINEAPGSSAADADNLNKMNDVFLQALADSGGFNAKRVVTLSGPGMGGDKVHLFRRPSNVTNPWAIQFHYYSPYDFIFGAWGKTVWGSEADKAAVAADLAIVRNNFTDVPVLLGEFQAAQTHLEPAARWKWFDHVVRTCQSLGITTVMWDNGEDNLDRATGLWRDKLAVDITMAAVKGVANSLADSTVDASATKQESSAYVFNRVGIDARDRTLPFILNGNTFKSLAVGETALEEGRDYTIAGSNVTLKQSFLSRYLGAFVEPGSKANVTVTFSSGVPSQIELVQWHVPLLGSTSSSAKDVPSGSELGIPIEWRGLHKVAAVKIAASGDGAYLVDDWTQWLPELQKGRGTYNSHWNFDNNRVVLTRGIVDTVIASGKNTTFAFEFFPREIGNGNTAEYTLLV
ncbi:glycoside hydrolase superfamily [Lasiosphaeris hirsuta]|uniref:Glycoside hydrolase superfamily n=1 Tax=Lasiosphaeris hirsuta TaxID=260670 RepID=A0AA40AQJ6_9PEZI|nr:glycoside hydrolase superfamily [Lasiosphaeris hirsuta]